MTRDEILAMPASREMDKLVAKIVYPEAIEFWIFPKYSAEIAAAWDVVDKFGGCILSKPPESNFWFCDFGGKDYEYSQAETAPLAICRAALLASIEQE